MPLGFLDALAVVLRLALDHDRVLDEIAVFLNRVFDDVGVGKIGQLIFEVLGTQFEDDCRAARIFLGVLDRV